MIGSNKWVINIANSKSLLGLRIFTYILVVAILKCAILLIVFNFYYANRFFANTYVDGVDISNLEFDQAYARLVSQKSLNDFNFEIKTATYQKRVTTDDIKFEFEINKTLMDIFKVQRNHKIIDQIWVNLKSFLARSNYQLQYSFDQNELNLLVTNIRFEGTNHYQEPYFIYKSNKIQVIAGKVGDDFDVENLKSVVIDRFRYIDAQDIIVEIKQRSPQVTDEIANTFVTDVQKIVNKKLRLKYDDLYWDLTGEDIAKMLQVQIDQNTSSVILAPDDNAILQKIYEIAVEIDRSPSAQILKVENGKVVEFGAPKSGRTTDVELSMQNIIKALFDESKSADLVVNITESPKSDNNEYGITELLATGTSKFAGSIKSRVHNIGLASSRVNGILVAPGETFSFVKTVGEINRKSGYQTAYVISGGRTVLGDGGGVCQVSTTLFRAALNAGLQIVERNPHSYRVGYYEQESPPGIDAAIYSPSVDLKFINNTPNHILIVSEFDAKRYSLKYSIYGTSDGRKVNITEPKILSRTAPRAPIYEVNPNLPKGTKKLMEGSVWGASVTFDREVLDKDGNQITKDTYKSNYRAWPAVYQIGPE